MADNTVVSNSSANAPHGIECASCGSANPFGMRFCLSCGRPALYSQMTEKIVGPCPLCGCADPLNQAFCIACGTALIGADSPAVAAKAKRTGTVVNAAGDASSSANTVKHKTGFSWESPANAKTPTKSEFTPRPVKVAVSGRRGKSLAPVVATGILAGVLVAVIVSNTAPARYAFERLHWPARGLVVYAQPPKAKVVLENVETQAITLAQTEDNGCLTMGSTQPGRYRLFLKAPADDGAFADVTVLPDRPTVVGFPTPISLTGANR
ncbi:MAG: zinc ribbon domain-containing protein [Candidatus Obscuribacterales bacterium]|nr:zinc ribbon domain-containing protein [Candidatus Obscuribacterales bacterium]